mgnify:FL=1
MMNKHWMKVFAVAVVLGLPMVLASHFGQAAGDAHEGGGLPTMFWLQVVNFTIYLGAIIFFARGPLREMFKGRYDGFFSAVKRAEAAKAEAEMKRKEIQDRLAKLEATRDESIQKARSDAAALRNQIVEEAKSLSAKLKADAERTAQLEVERAKYELREELLAQSVQMSKRILTDKMQDQDQKRLQSEFVDKIQVVSQ